MILNAPAIVCRAARSGVRPVGRLAHGDPRQAHRPLRRRRPLGRQAEGLVGADGLRRVPPLFQPQDAAGPRRRRPARATWPALRRDLPRTLAALGCCEMAAQHGRRQAAGAVYRLLDDALAAIEAGGGPWIETSFGLKAPSGSRASACASFRCPRRPACGPRCMTCSSGEAAALPPPAGLRTAPAAGRARACRAHSERALKTRLCRKPAGRPGAAMTFQEIILELQRFWSRGGVCLLIQPYDLEKARAPSTRPPFSGR